MNMGIHINHCMARSNAHTYEYRPVHKPYYLHSRCTYMDMWFHTCKRISFSSIVIEEEQRNRTWLCKGWGGAGGGRKVMVWPQALLCDASKFNLSLARSLSAMCLSSTWMEFAWIFSNILPSHAPSLSVHFYSLQYFFAWKRKTIPFGQLYCCKFTMWVLSIEYIILMLYRMDFHKLILCVCVCTQQWPTRKFEDEQQ